MSELLKQMEARAVEIEERAKADAAELRRMAAAASRVIVADPDRWVNVANYLGEAVSRKVSRGACRAGAIEGARKVGKSWVARARDVDAWIEKQTPTKQCDTEAEYLEKWRRSA